MAIAWVFPGQGSQKVGMADPLLSMSGANERFNQASELLGRDLLAICQGDSGRGEGPDDLNDTRNTQPALFCYRIASGRQLATAGPRCLFGSRS